MSGMVYLEGFDRGIIVMLGSTLEDADVGDGLVRPEYGVPIPGIQGPPQYGGRVPVYFIVGASRYTPKLFPSIVIRRTEVAPDFSQGGTWYTVDYRMPAQNANTVVVTMPDGSVISGPDRVEIKERATPHRLVYTATLEARGDRAGSEAVIMHRFVAGRCLPPGGSVPVIDSLGDERTYDCLVEISPELSVLDMTARSTIFAFTYTVKGELDFQQPVEAPTMVSVN